jgi:DNA-binding CsgD family transcriptional regulator
VRAAGLRVDEAYSLQNLGWLAFIQEDYSTARALCEEAASLARAVGDELALCYSLIKLEQVALRQGDLLAAKQLVEEGLALARRLGDRTSVAASLEMKGQIAIAEGHHDEARRALREGLLIRQDQVNRPYIAELLEGCSALAAAETAPQRAIQLAGAGFAIREATGERLTPMRQAMVDKWLLPLRQALGEGAFRSAWEAGRAMSIEQAVELALAAVQPRPEQPDQAPDEGKQRVTELSPREQQVAALLAEGLTNRQIAERLIVTERTVAAHIEHILDKLGFASRHQVATWAADNGLRSST